MFEDHSISIQLKNIASIYDLNQRDVKNIILDWILFKKLQTQSLRNTSIFEINQEKNKEIKAQHLMMC